MTTKKVKPLAYSALKKLETNRFTTSHAKKYDRLPGAQLNRRECRELLHLINLHEMFLAGMGRFEEFQTNLSTQDYRP